ncbi:sulfotransferase 1C4 [Nylanderia fulva]|uniref:sulfotransferase 1C4 n=1 Tax=Nylanderia fulva TaxID=613905 RepID=UPI0010FB04C8|nr:sulfotransferase 1C4 [Nylanderia fulva]
MNEGDAMKQQLCRDIAKPGYEIIASIPLTTPRFIKTHFPFTLLPGILDVGCKIVYVARNPKDVAVSWYNLNKAIRTQGFIGDFATFWNYFENDLTPWSPYWAHVLEAWDLKDHPNVLFIFYEEMQNDFPKTIKKIAEFLGKTYSDEEINKVAKFLDIENFRTNDMVNMSELRACGIIEKENFIRKGGIGGWKDVFTPELDVRADMWIQKNLKNTDLRFPFFNNNN